jgi:hypothetical protein
MLHSGQLEGVLLSQGRQEVRGFGCWVRERLADSPSARRIAELMKRKNRKRLAKEAEIARKEARGDFSHLKVRFNPLLE